MKDPRVRLVLDTSAVLAYVATSINVGETVAEVADEGAMFGVSVLCLAEASRLVTEEHRPRVRLLLGHPCAVVLPVLAEDWSALAAWTTVLGRLDLAASLLEAIDRDAYVLTGEPDGYDDGRGDLPVIPV